MLETVVEKKQQGSEGFLVVVRAELLEHAQQICKTLVKGVWVTDSGALLLAADPAWAQAINARDGSQKERAKGGSDEMKGLKTTMSAVARDEKGGDTLLMRRILVLLAVVALLLVMLAMSVAPAFADGGPGSSCAAWFGSNHRAPYCPAVYRPGVWP